MTDMAGMKSLCYHYGHLWPLLLHTLFIEESAIVFENEIGNLGTTGVDQMGSCRFSFSNILRSKF